ncbi:PQQ-binding-like beta-propeller repeat protein [Actinotalea ferrariae]|uniref:outer membrane protein assembly factor BamB family protein n=1 Tax=Actinotalea ferrariae TaxID=1386098 RepID=UPI001C8C7547|nr:PQQ-binding-like beta-propeller repeat protein [Actinotalea ferrariae]MBX9244418.1 PQQ-binding-like beta-propeller repeat protein [Actinotalea ferrariae]
MRGLTAQRPSGAPGQVEVELVEDDVVPPSPGRPVRTRAPHDAPSRHRAPTHVGRRAVAVLGLVAVAVTVATVSETRADAEQLAAVAALPGSLEPVEGPLVPSWSVPGSMLMGLTADLALLQTSEATLAVDVATGATVWDRRVEDGVVGADDELCVPLRAPGPAELAPAVRSGPLPGGPAGDAALIACLRESPVVREAGRIVTQQARVAVLAADDGTELHGWTTRGLVVLVEHLGGDDVVAAVRTPGENLEVARWDVRTGERRWHTVTEQEVDGPVHGVWHASVDDGTLTVDDPRPLRLDVDTGQVLGRRIAASAFAEQPLAVRPPLHDGTGPAVGLRAAAEVVAVDTATGEDLWRRTGPATPLVQVGGLVVLREEEATVALAAGTGEVVWTVPTAAHVRFGPLLDGRVLLLPVAGRSALSDLPGARPRPVLDLIAVDPADGIERWRSALPTGTFTITATPGGHVVVGTTGGVVGLGHRSASPNG